MESNNLIILLNKQTSLVPLNLVRDYFLIYKTGDAL